MTPQLHKIVGLPADCYGSVKRDCVCGHNKGWNNGPQLTWQIWSVGPP